MARIGPAFQFQFFRGRDAFHPCRRGIGIAAVRADEPVDHQLQRTWCLIPVDGRHDHHAVGCDPLRINFRHPVVDLSEREVRIAGAGPVAERLRGREARLAGIDRFLRLGGEQAQIKHFGFEALLFLDQCAAHLDEAPGLRHFAGASLVAAGGAVHDENARG